MEIRYEMWNVLCEREVRVQLERARCRRKSGLKVEGVHWLRALVGALDSLAASEMVVCKRYPHKKSSTQGRKSELVGGWRQTHCRNAYVHVLIW
jgi:hypothetical protein